jgi:hypothetical protein
VGELFLTSEVPLEGQVAPVDEFGGLDWIAVQNYNRFRAKREHLKPLKDFSWKAKAGIWP